MSFGFELGVTLPSFDLGELLANSVDVGLHLIESAAIADLQTGLIEADTSSVDLQIKVLELAEEIDLASCHLELCPEVSSQQVSPFPTSPRGRGGIELFLPDYRGWLTGRLRGNELFIEIE